MPVVTVTALKSHRRTQAEYRLAVGPGYDNLDDVFAGPNGEPLVPRSTTRRFKRLAVQAGLPDLTVHGLRHTFATVALGSGIAGKVAQEMLGHASIGRD